MAIAASMPADRAEPDRAPVSAIMAAGWVEAEAMGAEAMGAAGAKATITLLSSKG